MTERAWQRLSRAAGLALVTHLVAGLAMWFVLRHGLDSQDDLNARLAFLRERRSLWIAGWLPWTAAALSMLWFCGRFRAAHGLGVLAERTVLVAVVLDLSAQWIETAVLPELAAAESAERFLQLHRTAVLLTGFGANGLYTLGVLLLAWETRGRYAARATAPAAVVVLAGSTLSAAVLLDSVAGMVWSNVVLVPALLAWLLAVGRDAATRRAGPSGSCCRRGRRGPSSRGQ